MTTTLTTQSVRLADGTLYRPDAIVRALRLSTVSSGSTHISAAYQTDDYTVARVYAKALTNAASTFSLACITGQVSSDVEAWTGSAVLGSSGNTAFSVPTTLAAHGVFVGLDRYTAFRVIEAGGTTVQDLAVDVEFA